MTNAEPNYRFKCVVVDDANDMLVISDFTFIGPIDEYGGCESVDMTVSRMLRQLRRIMREQELTQ